MKFFAELLIVLSIACYLIAIVGFIKPSIFKDRKTNVIPSRLKLLGSAMLVGVLATSTAFLFFPDKERQLSSNGLYVPNKVVVSSSEKPLVDTEIDSNQLPLPPQTSAHVLSSGKEPMDKEVAQELAMRTYRLISDSEDILLAGVKADDLNGINKYVLQPLRMTRQEWVYNNSSGIKPQPITIFSSCEQAIIELELLASGAISLTPGAYRTRYLKEQEDKYYAQKELCKEATELTGVQVQEKITADEIKYKEIVKSLGGEDCFSIIGVIDGKVTELPKPAHCKK